MTTVQALRRLLDAVEALVDAGRLDRKDAAALARAIRQVLTAFVRERVRWRDLLRGRW